MCNKNKYTTAVVLAGGRGSRMESDIPKQYMNVCGYPLIYYSLKAFSDSEYVDEIVLVCGAGDAEYCKKEIVDKYELVKVTRIVTGGAQRYNSVANGIMAASNECEIIYIHDGARPFITCDIIKKAYEETAINHATVIAVPSKDTIKVSDRDGFAKDTPDRNTMWIVQTPQTFDYKAIKEAYQELIEREEELTNAGVAITDDAMVMERFGSYKVKLVEGDYKNIKVTTPEDIIIANAYLTV